MPWQVGRLTLRELDAMIVHAQARVPLPAGPGSSSSALPPEVAALAGNWDEVA